MGGRNHQRAAGQGHCVAIAARVRRRERGLGQLRHAPGWRYARPRETAVRTPGWPARRVGRVAAR